MLDLRFGIPLAIPERIAEVNVQFGGPVERLPGTVAGSPGFTRSEQRRHHRQRSSVGSLQARAFRVLRRVFRKA